MYSLYQEKQKKEVIGDQEAGDRVKKGTDSDGSNKWQVVAVPITFIMRGTRSRQLGDLPAKNSATETSH
eukprot:1148150-Pelagomonas_calceolata.AAC.1